MKILFLGDVVGISGRSMIMENLLFQIQNRKIDLAEYYNLIYEYKNDCLIAGIKYNKTYYSDRDLQPSEELMFNLTLIPITSIGQTVSK